VNTELLFQLNFKWMDIIQHDVPVFKGFHKNV